MKVSFLFSMLFIYIMSGGFTTITKPFATAEIHNVWADHNEIENGQKGMIIHVKFRVSGMRARSCQVAAYFYQENGSPIKDQNNHYNTSDGNVSCHKDFTPSYENTSYEDFTLFMPYGEFHVDGRFDLKYFVVIWGNGQQLASSDYQPFSLTWNAPEPPRRAIPNVAETGSLTCEVECPKKGYSCGNFTISIGNSEYRNSAGLSSSGVVTFPNVPEGTYNVSINLKDSKKLDDVSSPPYSPLTKRVTVRAGERS